MCSTDDDPTDDPGTIPFSALSGAARDGAFMEVERVRRQAEALLATMLAQVDASLSFVDDGHRNAGAWLQAVANCSQVEAAARLRAARMIRDVPEVGQALAVGHLGSSQTVELARLHANDVVRPHLSDAARLLVEHGCLLAHADFRVVCQRFEQHADPDGMHRDHQSSRANRFVSFASSAPPGRAGFELRVAGDALSGAVVADVLDAFTTDEFDLDWSEGRSRHGDAMTPRLMARTARQRRYDAFVKICRTAAEATASTPLQPLVNIHCDAETLVTALRDCTDGGQTSSADRPAWSRRRCETSSGAPVDPADLVLAALTGRVRKVVSDANGRIIDLGRRQRLFAGAARDAVLLSGDRCRWPGCSVRAGNIQIDHTVSWAAELGPTAAHNGAPACSHHNLVKERGFTQVRSVSPDGGWITARTDGSPIGPRASPATTRSADATCAPPPS